jgi:hypothetical protein
MKKSTIIAIATAFLGFSAYAASQPESLTLRVYEDFSYNDNVFLDPNGLEKGSMISRTGLELGVLRNKGSLALSLAGSAEDVRCWKYPSRDYIGYDIIPKATYDQGRWRLTLGGRFSYDLTAVDSTNIQQYETYLNGLNALWDYDWNEVWGLELDGSWNQRIFVGQASMNSNDYVVGIAPYYRLSSRTKVGLHAGYGSCFYDQNTQQADSNRMFMNAFVDYQLTGRMTLRLEGGYIYRQYAGVNGVSGQTWDGFNAKASLRYQPGRKWTMDATLSMQPTDSYTMTATAQSKLKIAYDASLGVTWSVTDRLKVEQRLAYTLSDDKSFNLDNQLYGYKLDVRYQLTRHVGISVGYAYSAIAYSQLTDSDYKQNIVKAGLSWHF